MEQPRQTFLTADAFLAWSAEQPSGRFELDGGVVVAMAPERISHALTKVDATNALRAGIRKNGLPCEVLPDGVSLRIDEGTVYEPDTMVRCGPPAPRDATEAADPVVVVEVVSPSSRGVDTGAKLLGYFSLPSVRHYLILDAEKRAVIHHRRAEDGTLSVRILHDELLVLDPPGIEVATGDFFASL